MFGQLVLGAPGSGKTTYCRGLGDYFRQTKRRHVLINFDPGNEISDEFVFDVDIRDLVDLNEVCVTHELGPNGGQIYAMEYVLKNVDWVKQKIVESIETKYKKLDELELEKVYLIFDCPGQMELYLHSRVMSEMFNTFNKFGYRLAAVNLVDVLCCLDTRKYISSLLSSLSILLQLEIPQVNLMTKIDLVNYFGGMSFRLKTYAECFQVEQMLREDEWRGERDRKLEKTVCALAASYDYIQYLPIAVEDVKCMVFVVHQIDRQVGYPEAAAVEEKDTGEYFQYVEDKYDHAFSLDDCRFCSAELGEKLICDGCKKVAYCSQECREADANSHKDNCRLLKS